MSQESTSKKNERNMSAENFDRNIHSIIFMIADIQEQTQCSLNYGQSNTGNAYNKIFNHK